MDISTFNRAKAAYDAQEWETAAILFSACTDGPGSGEACHLRGNALMRLGRVQEAIEAYRRCADDPTYQNRGAVYTNLGKAQVALGDYKGAVQSLRTALEDENYPGAYKAWLALGGAYSRLGDARSAGVAYRKAALEANNPDPAKALINLGVCFVQMRRPEDAASAYRTALDFSQDANERDMILSNLGQAYVASNRMVEAVKAFDEATSDGYQLLPPAQADYEKAKRAADRLAGSVAGAKGQGSTADLIASIGGENRPDPLDPLGRSGEVMPSPDQSGFFTLSDEQIEAAGKKAIRADRGGRHHGLRALVVVVILVVVLVAAAAVAYLVGGFGIPSRETSIDDAFLAAEEGGVSSQAWARDVSSAVQRDELAGVTQGSTHEISGMDYSASDSSTATALVTVTLPQGGTLLYDVTLSREGFGWKVSEVAEEHSSVDQDTFSSDDATPVTAGEGSAVADAAATATQAAADATTAPAADAAATAAAPAADATAAPAADAAATPAAA